MNLKAFALFGRNVMAAVLLCVGVASMASVSSPQWRGPIWTALLCVAGVSLLAGLPRLMPHYRMTPAKFWADRLQAAEQGAAPLFLPAEVVANWVALGAFAFHAFT